MLSYISETNIYDRSIPFIVILRPY